MIIGRHVDFCNPSGIVSVEVQMEQFFVCYRKNWREETSPFNDPYSVWSRVVDYPQPEIGKPIPGDYIGNGSSKLVVIAVLDTDHPAAKLLNLINTADEVYGTDGAGMEMLATLLNLISTHALTQENNLQKTPAL